MNEGEETTAALPSAPAAHELVVCWEEMAQAFELTRASLSSLLPSFLIGRGEGADVRVPHGSVSRAHARLHIGRHGFELEDLGSANGLRVDGVAVTGRLPVGIGAMIELGGVRAVIRTKPSGAPSPMVEVRRLVERVAPSTVSLILLGETGVGKEVLTEEIHARSGRKGPLVRLNCAGFSATLIESELFGHERGAFTGAVQAKAGLIESAHEGTLFLDELSEMPEATQPKLLRVLESGEVRRLGALKTRAIDVRFVSATHKDPRTLAAVGKFREDLLFRLNGFTLHLPALRERRGEIVALAEVFLQEASERAKRSCPRLSQGARTLLESHRWPGNIRELRNVMNRVALLCEDAVVRVEHLSFDPATPKPAPPAVGTAELPPALAAPADVEDGERGRIQRALAEVGGNQAAAAKALGLTARVLAYRMDKLGLPRPRRS